MQRLRCGSLLGEERDTMPLARQRSPPAAAGDGQKLWRGRAPSFQGKLRRQRDEATAPAEFAQGDAAKSHGRSKGCVLRQTTRHRLQRQQTAPERCCRENAARPGPTRQCEAKCSKTISLLLPCFAQNFAQSSALILQWRLRAVEARRPSQASCRLE